MPAHCSLSASFNFATSASEGRLEGQYGRARYVMYVLRVSYSQAFFFSGSRALPTNEYHAGLICCENSSRTAARTVLDARAEPRNSSYQFRHLPSRPFYIHSFCSCFILCVSAANTSRTVSNSVLEVVLCSKRRKYTRKALPPRAFLALLFVHSPQPLALNFFRMRNFCSSSRTVLDRFSRAS